ncbi:MAG: hypothetical protein KDA21_15380, partial [Phycisphaerales bacterium]|nr:hypothetical protein [Phycisphaerales bacterium]
MAKRANRRGSLYKRSGSKVWHASWYDADGKRRRLCTNTTDKAAAARILEAKVAQAALRREGVIDRTQDRLAIEGRRPIAACFEAWSQSLEAKGTGDKRRKMVTGRAARLIEECGFETLTDIDAAKVHDFIRRRQDRARPVAARTINGYLQSFRQMIRFAIVDGRLASDPIPGITAVKVIGQTRRRRPLTAEELDRLFAHTATAPTRRGLAGPDRVMVYR